jgi:hypothetical protein
MKTNTELTQEYFDIIAGLDGDIEGRQRAAEYMARSTAIVHDKHVACSFIPRLFNDRTYRAMKECAETAHRILCKVMQHYLDDPDYRDVFHFDPRLEEIILIPRRYDSLLPFARVDTFMNEDDYTFKFCEFNGDGSAGMNENREITLSVAGTPTFREFVKSYRVQTCEIFNQWVGEFIDIYETFENRVKNPRFAIADYLDHGVVAEFKHFARLFEYRGYPCTVVDVRELTFDGEVLRDKNNQRVDAIWRRCVTNDVLEFWDETQPLIEAVRAGKVALIGSFAGHIIHDKQINKALFHPKTRAFLTEDEAKFVDETVPFTAFLNDDDVDLEEIRTTKDKWIIKPTDAYGGDGVYAGAQVDQQTWDEVVDKYANGAAGAPFIVQTFISPYKTDTIPYETVEELANGDKPVERAQYNNLNGLYLLNGKFGGVFSRLGPKHIITKPMGSITAATIWVHDEQDPFVFEED